MFPLLIFSIFFLPSQGLNFSNFNFTHETPAKPPQGGLFIQISQSGLDYMAKMAEKAIPKLLVNYSIPAASGAGFSVSKMRILEMAYPNISANFESGLGLVAELHFSELQVVGVYEASMLWMTKKGVFKGIVSNLTIELLLTVTRGSENEPVFKVPVCQGETGQIALMFSGGFSGVLNTVRGFMESYLSSQLDEILCLLTVEATKFFEGEVTQQKGESTPKFDPTLLCEDLSKKKKSQGLAAFFDINFQLSGSPYFTDKHALLGMDGELLFQDKSVHLPLDTIDIAWGSKMISFMVAERVPNTFFQHIFNEQIGTIEEELTTRDFPKMLQAPLQLLCWSCKIILKAGMTEGGPVPTTSIDGRGVTISGQGEVRVTVDGPFRKFDIFRATLNLEMTAKPFIQQNAIYARNLKLSSYQTSVRDVGLGGFIGKPIQEIFTMLIPRKVWPKIRRRLRFAFRHRGYRLPVVCGVQLTHTRLFYAQDAVLADTDFVYNLDNFVEKFKQHILK